MALPKLDRAEVIWRAQVLRQICQDCLKESKLQSEAGKALEASLRIGKDVAQFSDPDHYLLQLMSAMQQFADHKKQNPGHTSKENVQRMTYLVELMGLKPADFLIESRKFLAKNPHIPEGLLKRGLYSTVGKIRGQGANIEFKPDLDGSLVGDGVAFGLDHTQFLVGGENTFRTKNKAYVGEAARMVREENAGHVIVSVGSNRQNAETNSSNAMLKKYSLAHPMAEITDEIQSKCPEQKVTRDNYLTGDLASGRLSGETYAEIVKYTADWTNPHYTDALTKLEKTLLHEIDPSHADHSKFLMLYRRLHEVARQLPSEKNILVFTDDRDDILSELKSIFSKYPELIPQGVELRMAKLEAGEFVEKDEQGAVKWGKILGKGQIDCYADERVILAARHLSQQRKFEPGEEISAVKYYQEQPSRFQDFFIDIGRDICTNPESYVMREERFSQRYTTANAINLTSYIKPQSRRYQVESEEQQQFRLAKVMLQIAANVRGKLPASPKIARFIKSTRIDGNLMALFEQLRDHLGAGRLDQVKQSMQSLLEEASVLDEKYGGENKLNWKIIEHFLSGKVASTYPEYQQAEPAERKRIATELSPYALLFHPQAVVHYSDDPSFQDFVEHGAEPLAILSAAVRKQMPAVTDPQLNKMSDHAGPGFETSLVLGSYLGIDGEKNPDANKENNDPGLTT